MTRRTWKPRMASDGVTWCETARHYAEVEKISCQAAYKRAATNWPNPRRGRPPTVTNFRYMDDKIYPDVRTCAEANGKSIQAVRSWLDRQALREAREAADVPPLPTRGEGA